MCNKHHELHVEINQQALKTFLQRVNYPLPNRPSSGLWSHMMGAGSFRGLLLHTFMFAASRRRGIRTETLAEYVDDITTIHFRISDPKKPSSGKSVRETSMIFGNLSAVSAQLEHEAQLNRDEAFRSGSIMSPA